jgi:branched-subunit amino acid transport protein AzlD
MLDKYKKLRIYNLIMGLIHLFQGVVIIYLSKNVTTKVDIFLPEPDFITRKITSIPQHFIDIRLDYLLVSFLWISAFAHIFTVLPRVFPKYIENLKLEKNMIRWYEYGISSSIMVVLIAYLCNIQDVTILALMFFLNSSMIFFGAVNEMYNSDLKESVKLHNFLIKRLQPNVVIKQGLSLKKYEPNWYAFIYGSVAGFIPWVVLFVYFFYSLAKLDGKFEVPSFVYYVIYGIFIFFNLFAINMYLQYKKIGKWKSYLFGECMYILLSLISKSLLAWLVFGGLLQR